jgi:protein-S-isoprenylcysteine O-methyltransferase Ste14
MLDPVTVDASSSPPTAALWARSFLGLVFLQLLLAVMLFAPAGTLRWWEAWVYWSVFLVAVAGITVHFLLHDPALISRRLAVGPVAERRRAQKVIQAIAQVGFALPFVVSAIDHRFHGSVVPAPLALAADALVALGFLVVFLVFRENSHASATIEVHAGQRVVTTGPYRYVRHPMYAGALLLMVATPIALGSVVALPSVLPLVAVIVARLVDEERLLARELPGYEAYCREVRFRLVPGGW